MVFNVILHFVVAGNLGGLCGIITGFSLVSAVEIVYFIMKQLYLTLRQRFQQRYSEVKMKAFNFYP